MPHGQMPATPPSRPLRLEQPNRSASLWLGALGAVLGLLGLLVGVAAWYRSAPQKAVDAVYTEQQVADAKKAVCDAYAEGVRSFRIAADKNVDNPADKLPVAVNTRVAEVAVSNYLNNAVDANPAAPVELQRSVRQLADSYLHIALTQLAEGTVQDIEPFGLSADDAIAETNRTCP